MKGIEGPATRTAHSKNAGFTEALAAHDRGNAKRRRRVDNMSEDGAAIQAAHGAQAERDWQKA
jgi:hypothetical protein